MKWEKKTPSSCLEKIDEDRKGDFVVFCHEKIGFNNQTNLAKDCYMLVVIVTASLKQFHISYLELQIVM